MNYKKMTSFLLASSLVISVFSMSFYDIHAENFAGQESKYIKLCSSSTLTTKQQKTCKEFNTYLNDKNKKLNKEAQKAKENIKETKATLKELEQQVKDTEKRIKEAQEEINYVNSHITKMNKDMKEKNELLQDRLYTMQTSLNSDMFLSYLFGATSFGDFIQRVMNIRQITSYEQELIEELKSDIKEVEKQKSTLTLLQNSLKEDKEKQVKVKDQYYDKLIRQNSVIENNDKAVSQNQESIESIKENLEAIQKASDESKVDNVTQAKPKPKPKPPKPNEGNKPSEGNNSGNDNSNNNTDNTESDDSNISENEKIGLAIANKALTRQGYMYSWGGSHSMSEIKNPNQTKFDCSGLVNWAHYQAGVNIGINNTKSLASKGKSISRNDLQAGDIILFSSNGDYNGIHHVGIYIGDNKMVHAPSSGKPVQVARLSINYWQKEWYSTRRLY